MSEWNVRFVINIKVTGKYTLDDTIAESVALDLIESAGWFAPHTLQLAYDEMNDNMTQTEVVEAFVESVEAGKS
jgi:hypothetical protein